MGFEMEEITYRNGRIAAKNNVKGRKNDVLLWYNVLSVVTQNPGIIASRAAEAVAECYDGCTMLGARVTIRRAYEYGLIEKAESPKGKPMRITPMGRSILDQIYPDATRLKEKRR